MESEQLTTNPQAINSADGTAEPQKEKKPQFSPNQLKNILESLLFIANKPASARDLAKFLDTDQEAVQKALELLANEKKSAGVVLLENNGEYQMASQPKNSTQVKNFLNLELREKLTEATVEVLAIVSYRQPISKAELEAIRGVNSQYSLRHLLMRGLIEKIPNPTDGRSFLYQTTTEFLQHLGLLSVNDLPEFEKLVSQIKLPEAAISQETTENQALQSETQAPPAFLIPEPGQTQADQKIPEN
jgi:segregation and condensation protein B